MKMTNRIYEVKTSKRYRHELKKIRRRGKDESKLENIIDILASGGTLPSDLSDHQLSGKLKDYRECHIEPN